jgi:hypothetical protein
MWVLLAIKIPLQIFPSNPSLDIFDFITENQITIFGFRKQEALMENVSSPISCASKNTRSSTIFSIINH